MRPITQPVHPLLRHSPQRFQTDLSKCHCPARTVKTPRHRLHTAFHRSGQHQSPSIAHLQISRKR
ncbi:Uncharacterised protein [Vibrio cholerae]|nr:Uncharacterised protein [Vibrio cholerae]